MTYDNSYFEWQKHIGAFGGHANLFKFSDFINESDIVLDFGCGGGYLLGNIECADKAGVEINEIARQVAKSSGITVYRKLNDVPDRFATLAISNHVLEHVSCPLQELTTLLSKLRFGGRAVFVVPHQNPGEPYVENDVNQHLYTWNPQTFGNLFKVAGFINIRVDVLQHKWPPNFTSWYKLLGQRRFDILCHWYAKLKKNYQIRAYAERPLRQ